MVLNKMKNIKGQSGFTIVELLIVIVVIGILAAITIVAYSGITARANGVQAQTNAESVQKVAEAFNADPTAGSAGYPDVTLLNAYAGSAKIPSGITVAAALPTSGTGKVSISYVPKGSAGAYTGGCVGWWNFGAATPAVWYVAVGNAVVPAGSLSCS